MDKCWCQDVLVEKEPKGMAAEPAKLTLIFHYSICCNKHNVVEGCSEASNDTSNRIVCTYLHC